MRPESCLFPRFTGFLLALAGAGSAATALQGRIVAQDSTGAGVEGVVVTLASSGEKDTTDREGAWGIGNVPVGVGARPATSPASSGTLRFEQGKLRVETAGRDVSGRSVTSRSFAASAQGPVLGGTAARSAAASGPDTLVYSWKGKVILRDTLSVLSDRQIVRKFDTTLNAAVTHGYVKDVRDGRIYRTVKVGTHVWMAENLALVTDSSYAYAGSATNIARYGRLYTWAAAMGLHDSCNRKTSCMEQVQPMHRGICPQGWHMPDTAEVNGLIRSVEADSRVGLKNGATAMKAKSSWTSGAATDLFGMRLLPAGYRDYLDKDFQELGNKTHLWTRHGINASMAWHYNLVGSYTDVEVTTTKDKPQAISVRCLQD